MAQWLVNRGDSQFTVDGLADLKRIAKQGELDAGDLIQPEGADDWLYALEIPELDGLLSSVLEDDDDLEFGGGGGGALRLVLFVVFGLVILGGGGAMAYFYTQLPSEESAARPMFGEGGAVSYTQLLTIAQTPLLAQPEPGADVVVSLPKDTPIDLVTKRAPYFKARTAESQVGWVAVDDVLAAYTFGNDKVRRKMDPLYNPDQYVTVANASWHMIEDPDLEQQVATFSFLMQNSSMYPMTDLHLEVVIKDSKGTEVDTIEFEIEGVIPPNSSTMVGTLAPLEEAVKEAKRNDEEPPEARLMATETFQERVDEIPDEDQEGRDQLYNRWLDGIEIPVEDNFSEASIRVIELRAVPDGGDGSDPE